MLQIKFAAFADNSSLRQLRRQFLHLSPIELAGAEQRENITSDNLRFEDASVPFFPAGNYARLQEVVDAQTMVILI